MRRIERDPVPWYGNDDIRLADVCHQDENEDPLVSSKGVIRGLLVGAVIWIIGIAAILALRGK